MASSTTDENGRTEIIDTSEDRCDGKSIPKTKERRALSYTNQRIRTRAQLKDYVIDTLGYPMHTIEISDEQLEDCIDDATQLYTKWATMPERYLSVALSSYQSPDENGDGEGIDLSDYNVANVDSIGSGGDEFGMFGADGLWGLSNCMLATGTYPFLGRSFGGSGIDGFTTYHAAFEFCQMAKRMTAQEFSYEFNPQTQMLTLIPSPADNPSKYKDMMVVFKCECIPEDSQLYGNNFVKRLAIAYAKIRVGAIRSKFTGAQFGSGVTLNTGIGDEGKQELADLIERIKKEESIGTGFLCG